jgi:hypothetical protein
MLLDLDAIFDPDRAERNRVPVTTPTDLPAHWRVLWDERAAIKEYDGGLPREVAEHLALVEVVQAMNAGPQA